MMTKIVVITGATGGLGIAMVERFTKQGDIVYVADLQQTLIDEVTAKFQPSKGVVLDVTDEAQVAKVMAQIIAEHGRIDVVVNNAGLQHRDKVEDFPVEKWDLLMDVMLKGPFLLTKHAFPHMKQAQYGRIINISSVHGLMATPEKSAYVAAKHGVLGLTDVSAIEGAPYGITVNAVCPGVVKTPLIEKQLQDVMAKEGISEQQAVDRVVYPKRAMERFILPEEIASMVVYLASDEASAITMEHIKVAGGM